MKKINYNQCGKYFAKGFKLKVHTQNVHEIENIRYESTKVYVISYPKLNHMAGYFEYLFTFWLHRQSQPSRS